MDFANEILDAIEIMVRHVVEDNATKIYTGICKNAKSDGSCEMDVNGKINNVKYYGGVPTYNATYRVFVPFGNMSAAFIIVPSSDGGSGGGIGISNYNQLTDKPSINNTTLSGNKSSADLGLYGTGNVPPYPVTSVNGKTGDVTIEVTGGGNVDSVNGKTGAVVLNASDVGALPDTTVIPTVNNATLSIQKNGVNVTSFTANSSTNKIANITVPTKTSDLTNDNNYITSSGAPVQSVNNKTGAVVLTQDDIGDGTTYVRTENNFTDALKQQIDTNKDDIKSVEAQINDKMNKNNPVGTGSFSMNRATGTTIGTNSVVLGTNNSATNENTVAEGVGTVATRPHQHIQGRYNYIDQQDDSYYYIAVVGNGTSENARSNAFVVDTSGNGWFSGNIFVGSESGTHVDDGIRTVVANGDSQFTLKSPNGTLYNLSVTNSGALNITQA